MNRVIFFIDGFNVYHALDDNEEYHKYKWLNYAALARCYVTQKDQISKILYFTAYADWNPPKVLRHKTLNTALRLNGVEIVFGRFRKVDKHCPLCDRDYKKHEEKQTDVNIAINLFQCALNDELDTAIIVSGDSDLIPAVKAVKQAFPAKQIGVVIPITRHAKELKEACDFHMKMKQMHLRSAQFPDVIPLDDEGRASLQRPPSWV